MQRWASTISRALLFLRVMYAAAVFFGALAFLHHYNPRTL